jgi:hypothetical protein
MVATHGVFEYTARNLMDQLPKDSIPEGWAKYGLPGPKTVDLRNKIYDLLWQAIEKKGIKKGAECWRQMSISAGAKIFFVILTDPLIAEHREEVDKIIRENLPEGYSYEVESSQSS